MITVHNLYKTYGTKAVVTDISLEFPTAGITSFDWTEWCREINVANDDSQTTGTK